MKEHPILFSGEMVRAILGGRKMQTRRVMKQQSMTGYLGFIAERSAHWFKQEDGSIELKCPYGIVGDRLWVRESFAGVNNVIYKADEWQGKVQWTPGIYMPRTTSRITIEIVGVRVQRLADISEDEATAEGVNPSESEFGGFAEPHVICFMNLWNNINAKRGYGWDKNPWVWVIDFKRI